MGHEEYVRNELKEYLKLAKDFDIEINGKNFVDLINIIGGNYFEY